MNNKRLKKILEYIPPAKVLADIGTDHGYIPVEALLSQRAPKAIASDISKGSLQKAIQEIQKHQLHEKIDSRLGGGLDILQEEEADVVIIAGMGGNLIGDILEKGYDKKYKKTTPLLILQPVQFPEKLRENLCRLGFRIEDEDLVKDEGLIYHLILARKEGEKASKPMTMIQLEFGPINIEKGKPLLWELIESKIQTYEKIVEDLSKQSTSRSIARVEELREKITIYGRLIDELVEKGITRPSEE